MFDLVIIGEINPDIILHGTDVVPAFGQVEKLVDSAEFTVGSSSVITACGAARLGLNVAFVGVVGDDIYGQFMLDAMQSRGIDTSHCIVDPALQTGFTVILARPDGDRAMLTYSGSISALKAEQVDRALISQTRHLHVGSYFLLDALRPDLPDLFEQAHSAGATTSLDTNWDPHEQWSAESALSLCDILLPNSAEAQQLARRETLDEALDVLAESVPTIAVKLGAEGGLVRHNGQTIREKPIPVDVVDTVGAGDSFNAGFLYGFIHQFPMSQNLQLALACGSLSTLAAGGTTSQPTLDEALAAVKTPHEFPNERHPFLR